MLLPLNLLRQLQLGRKKKAGLAGVFAVGLLIMVFAVVRLVEVTQATAAVALDPTRVAESPIKLSAWSHIEGSVSIIVASLPTFQFLRRGGTTSKSSNKSPQTPQDIGKSLRTIGSSRANVKRSHPDDSLFETLVDDEHYDSKEMHNLSQNNIGIAEPYRGPGITKHVGYSVREEPASDEDDQLRSPQRAQHTRISQTHGYQSRLRDSALIIQSNAV